MEEYALYKYKYSLYIPGVLVKYIATIKHAIYIYLIIYLLYTII